MLLGQTPQPEDEAERSPQTPKAASKPNTRRVAPDRPTSSRWLAIAAAFAVVLGGAYGGYEYIRWQPAEPGTRDAEAKQLAALIESRRKEAADAAQRQVELEAERRRNEAAEAAQRQAAIDAEQRSKEAADAARRQAELDAERQRKEAAAATHRQAEIDAERRRKDEAERIAAAEEVARKAEAIVKSASDREALTRSLQTALNRVGCYRGEIDGQWGTQGRAALAQFAKLTKVDFPTDEPSMVVLEAVVARNGRVCPLECDADKVEKDGKCVPKASKTKNREVNKGDTARGKPRAERPSAQATSQRVEAEPQKRGNCSENGGFRGGRGAWQAGRSSRPGC
jgi:hypothetical protein